ncbi:PREDICTED: aromatic-L-amino-acid decarboxylase-like isoform X1 [Vollenhovia emeryi]|uniref:aromatic-L-amino-acid decarboxylase-like isoform X1 n=1 Tax=Vollenhovia emeryi TaxID=411798 RepID=UPI0005F4A8D1|nr:PREDICTED: aromatic-L-amino-acid decarboxylase-like isoform X1 [Vollenhovia emeryi]XP_011867955.1 PREDICTED: aromatic-L-amino-acid decarboxylase-like isoform X1 [Vollenhovia emeryi]
MDPESFTDSAKEMTEYITNYMENIRDRRVLPKVKPGYMRPLVPSEAPQTPEQWKDVMADIERVIMPGVTHWQSPNFNAFFPAGHSYPSILADMLSAGIGCIGFSWFVSPACTELEVIVLDWLVKMLALPKEFLSCSVGKGGGVILGSASEGTLVTLLGAKTKKLKEVKEQYPNMTENEIVDKLVAYCSSQAHTGVERAGRMGGVKLRQLEVDEKYQLRGDTFAEAIRKDIEEGFIPFYIVATLGTTASCAFDRLDEIGIIANREDVWLHVDAAYAGSAFICPEFRYLMKGIETVNSFNFNPHKWMLVNFDCSVLWLKNPTYFTNAFNVEAEFLKHEMQDLVTDYRHWQIPLARRFRSLKLWFVMRLYGVENLQKYIRSHVAQAHEFEALVLSDPRFEIIGHVLMGLVCFRLKGSNELNKALLKKINDAGNIYLIPAKIKCIYFLRFAVCSEFSESKDIEYSWKEIKLRANEILEE